MAKMNLLNSIKISRPKKSVFDLSHDVKLTCNMGDLIPVLCQEVIPSDRIKVGQECLMRLMPMVTPMMHQCDLTFHTFFVPERILWDEKTFEKWITNQQVLGALPAYPTVQMGDGVGDVVNVNTGDLADYLGLPLTGTGTQQTTVSAMPFAAYQLIWNEYYRDQNQQQEVDYKLVDGDNTLNTDLFVLRKRAWEHDYFTACSPTPQAGAAVEIPLGQVFGQAPVLVNNPGGTTLDGTPLDVDVEAGVSTTMPADSLYTEVTGLNVTPTTINDLRTATRLQEWLEKSMRGGKRLFENILVFFGMKSPDARLQRPEYITGNKTSIQVSEVLQNSQSDATPQGNMAGHGITYVSPKQGVYNVQEWGFIITIMSVLPKTTYQQGIHKSWLKYSNPMEKYWPQFDHLGEQAVTNKEVYAYTPDDDDTFGYIPRYAEYKFMNSRVAGEMRTTLNFWHMGRIFTALPALNEDFIESDPTHRVFAVEDPAEHKLIVHVKNLVMAVRPMSKYSTPTF